MGNFPLFNHLLALCVPQPGHSTMGRRLLQTDLVRVQGSSQGLGRCGSTSGPRLGHTASIPRKRRGKWSLFCQLVALCVHRPGHIRRGGGCFKSTEIYVKGGPQGPGRCARCIGPSAEGTGCRSSTRSAMIGAYFVKF